MIFAVFLHALPDCAASCLAPCGLIWLKFYELNGRVHDYGLFPFLSDATRCARAAVEKVRKNDDFCCFLPLIAKCCDPLWANLDDILGVEWVHT